ncbi:hypothetical protein N7494_007796 [Penicillium frequentans]|uniref:Uncharacterized protein n=1 Tax=Penicillium frequentans TaxID=3151616 RepID=A0AAD6GF15_9EURO|nr:hypothetical protein N7494_007796 [Penicillium glabrum]
MPSDPEKFFQEKEDLVLILRTLPLHLFNTTNDDVEWKLFNKLKDIKKRIKNLINPEADTMDNTNKLMAERSTDYIVIVGTQLLDEPVDRELVFPELLSMIKIQIGRLRLKGYDDPMADTYDQHAKAMDEDNK